MCPTTGNGAAADQDQIIATFATGTRLRFVAMFNARQMVGQRLATGALATG